MASVGAFVFGSYWSAGFGTFLQAQALASHWLDDFADGTPKTGEKPTATLI